MLRRFRRLASLSLGILGFLGCPSDDNIGPDPIPVTVDRVTVSPSTVNLLVGAQQALSATALAANGTPIAGKAAAWSSNNTAAATVNATTGLVTAVGAGSAVITAVIDGRTGQATVQVTVPLHRLTVTTSGTGTGTVTSLPAGITCTRTAGVQAGSCAFDFPQGTVVTLTAAAASPDFRFGGWNNPGCGSLDPCQVTMTQPAQVGAGFDRLHVITVAVTGNGSGTVAAPAATLTCAVVSGQLTSLCQRTLAEGTVVVLTATAAPGSQFAGWSGGGCSGTGPCQVTLAQALTVTAIFLGPATLTVALDGPGRVQSSPAGIDCQRAEGGAQTGVCTFAFPPATVVTLSNISAVNHVFTGWGGSCSGTGGCTVTMSADRAVTVNFRRMWVLTITGSGPGTGRVASTPALMDCLLVNGIQNGPVCSAARVEGTVLTLSATPAEANGFGGWSGAGCSGTGTCQVTLTQNLQVTAAFAPLVSVTVVTAGEGNGTVTGAPAGINCTRTGSVQSGVCGTSYPQGTAVTLTAQAAAGSTFTGWNGEGCSGTGACIVQATQARTVTATFSAGPAVQHQLTVAMSGLGSGSVTSSPAGINCQLSSGAVSGTCAAPFPSGTVVTLTVQLTGNSTLSGWAGACTGTGTCQVTMNSARAVSAGLGLPPAPLGIGFGTAQWAYIPAGTFTMGSTTGEPDEQPVRQVTISAPFLMQKTEVTQAQWRQVMGTSPSWFSACGDLCPVESVSWDDVWQFIAALNAQSPGVNFRLPTEAQWEYATRAGTTGDYSVFGGLTGFAWYGVNSGLGGPRQVALLAPNPRGLYDVHGNVAEWVWDHYTPYTPGPQVDPRNVETEGNIVARGGSWFAHQYWLRSSARFWLTRQTKSYFTGFRLIRNP